MTRSPSPRLQPALQVGVLLLASAGAAAMWALLALALDRQIGWMAVVAALDAALVLRFIRMPAGLARVVLAVAGTLLSIALANWWIAGGQMGSLVGLPPWDAIPRLGPAHAWTLLGLANGTTELVWYALSLVTAAWIAR